MRVRPVAKAGPDWACQTINVSMLGAYFSADVAPGVGELVQVFIEIPQKVSGKADRSILLYGKSHSR